MEKKQIEILKTIVEEEEKNFEFNDYIFNYVDEEELVKIEDMHDLIEYLKNLNDNLEITQTDIIYYAKAIKYLAENDSALHQSLELAKYYGYTIDNINSELLASLLASENNLNDFEDFLKNIENRDEEIFN